MRLFVYVPKWRQLSSSDLRGINSSMITFKKKKKGSDDEVQAASLMIKLAKGVEKINKGVSVVGLYT